MLTLTRAKKAGGKAGEPLPTVFDKLANNGVHFRRGQLTLVAAAPGVGKSLFTMSLALGVSVPGFYFSADTDAFTAYLRCASAQTGWLMGDIETSVKAGATELIDTKLNATDYLRWSFDASPSLDDVDEELMAFAMTYGEWPQLIVIDNLRNLWMPDDSENHDKACDYLHELARKTGAAVVALHHVKGPYNDGNVPIPLSGIIGQIGKVPELILTLHKSGDEWTGLNLNVCPVKNRTGRADPSAGWMLTFPYEPARMMIGE